MAVKIRLTRTGARNSACYRVIAADARSPRDGRFLENLGWYDPKQAGVNFKLDLDRIEYWKGRGAQVSDTVRSLLRQARKAAPVVEAAPEEAPAPAEAVTAEEAPAVVDAAPEADVAEEVKADA